MKSKNVELEGYFIIDVPAISVYFLNCNCQGLHNCFCQKSFHYHPLHISGYSFKFIRHASTFLHNMIHNNSQASTCCMSNLCQEQSPVIFQGNPRCLSRTQNSFLKEKTPRNILNGPPLGVSNGLVKSGGLREHPHENYLEKAISIVWDAILGLFWHRQKQEKGPYCEHLLGL